MAAESNFLDQILLFYIPIVLIASLGLFIYGFIRLWVMRWYDDRVYSVTIGFGPKIFEFKDSNSTLWMVNLFPLFFYKLDFDYSNITLIKLTNRWFSSIIFGALSVIFAAFVTVLFATIIYGNLTLTPVIGKVYDSSAASEAGIVSGDKILSINGEKVQEFWQVRKHVVEKGDKPLEFIIRRNSQVITRTLVPKIKNNRYLIGVTVNRSPKSYDVTKVGITEAVRLSALYAWRGHLNSYDVILGYLGISEKVFPDSPSILSILPSKKYGVTLVHTLFWVGYVLAFMSAIIVLVQSLLYLFAFLSPLPIYIRYYLYEKPKLIKQQRENLTSGYKKRVK